MQETCMTQGNHTVSLKMRRFLGHTLTKNSSICTLPSKNLLALHTNSACSFRWSLLALFSFRAFITFASPQFPPSEAKKPRSDANSRGLRVPSLACLQLFVLLLELFLQKSQRQEIPQKSQLRCLQPLQPEEAPGFRELSLSAQFASLRLMQRKRPRNEEKHGVHWAPVEKHVEIEIFQH